MNVAADTLRDALRCGRPRCACRRGKQVHCPAHADEHPSLSVAERNGRVLVHCHAGCTQEAVLDALRSRGLWRTGSSRPAAPHLRPPQFRDLLLGAMHFCQRFVVLPSEAAAVAVTLWIAHAWSLDAFESTPYLIFQSATKRAGKTRMLELLELLTPRPWRVVGPSEAVLFRKIARDTPTLLLDEGDAIFSPRNTNTEPLRAVLNAGNRRGAVVARCVGEGQKLVDFPVFCAKAIAAIGDLPDTLLDRAVVVSMKRATPMEQQRLARLRLREAVAEAAPIREALARWATAATTVLRDARPEIPDALDGRAADAWEPLLAIADQAGDGWSVYALSAALALSTGPARGEDSLRVRLLADLQRVFAEHDAPRLSTSEILHALCAEETAPWADFHGRQLTPQGLSRLLRPFGVTPEKWRAGDVAGIRGYSREAFADAFSRYLPSEPPHAPQGASDGAVVPFSVSPRAEAVADTENNANPDPQRTVATVAVQPAAEGAR